MAALWVAGLVLLVAETTVELWAADLVAGCMAAHWVGVLAAWRVETRVVRKVALMAGKWDIQSVADWVG